MAGRKSEYPDQWIRQNEKRAVALHPFRPPASDHETPSPDSSPRRPRDGLPHDGDEGHALLHGRARHARGARRGPREPLAARLLPRAGSLRPLAARRVLRRPLRDPPALLDVSRRRGRALARVQLARRTRLGRHRDGRPGRLPRLLGPKLLQRLPALLERLRSGRRQRPQHPLPSLGLQPAVERRSGLVLPVADRGTLPRRLRKPLVRLPALGPDARLGRPLDFRGPLRPRPRRSHRTRRRPPALDRPVLLRPHGRAGRRRVRVSAVGVDGRRLARRPASAHGLVARRCPRPHPARTWRLGGLEELGLPVLLPRLRHGRARRPALLPQPAHRRLPLAALGVEGRRLALHPAAPFVVERRRKRPRAPRARRLGRLPLLGGPALLPRRRVRHARHPALGDAGRTLERHPAAPLVAES